MAAWPWVVGVVLLLAVADACQVVMARICTDAYNGFMRKLPLNGGNAMKAEECFILLCCTACPALPARCPALIAPRQP